MQPEQTHFGCGHLSCPPACSLRQTPSVSCRYPGSTRATGLRLATILIIDDTDVHLAEIRRAINPAGIFDRVIEANDGLQGLKVLLNDAVGVVLCDL